MELSLTFHTVLCSKRLSIWILFMRRPCNPSAYIAAHDGFVAISGALCALATCCNKVANDVRWLASGPRGGLGEITIAANEPGSSIMPGKVNPSQCEALSMMCVQVMGQHTAVTFAAAQGNFQLNAYKPLIAWGVLQSMELLQHGLVFFHRYCLSSIRPNKQRMTDLAQRSLMIATALAPRLGYDRTAAAVKRAHTENKTLKQVVVSMGWMNEQEFDAVCALDKMAHCSSLGRQQS